MDLLIHDARVLTLAGPASRRGAELAEAPALPRGWVLIDDGLISACGEGDPPESPGAERLDAGGRVLMPGFVDAHTHACWAGDRLDEWELKQGGASYLDILKAGGGIMSTVRAVREASEDELVEGLVGRLEAMAAEGTTTAEVKSGYGLTTRDELKMLRAIRRAGEAQPLSVVPTACIAHAVEQGVEDFVTRTVEETLPAVNAEFPGVAIDAYCEDGAWSLDDTVRLFEAAAALGHPLRVHADQFNALGMTQWARAHGVSSVDHLEATGPEELAAIAASDCFGVMLPCSGFHTDGRYGDGRGFLDAGGRLVIATNCNPGSSPSLSMPMAIALAVRHLGVTAGEAIAAATLNAAALLGLEDRGRIEPGLRADILLLRHRDERQLGYEFGGSHALVVVCGGDFVSVR
jgi:imidazolonepropionase